MDWQPHIVVKVEHDSAVKTATTALRTFDKGFPGKKAVVHYIGTNAQARKTIQQWCGKGGHKMVQYLPSTRQSQIHYTLIRNSRVPLVFIRGTAVFYEDMTGYSTTKLFGGMLLPKRYTIKGDKTRINLGGIDKTVVFVADPLKINAKVNELSAYWNAKETNPESKHNKKWDAQWAVIDGVIYQQESGVLNLLYAWDKSLVSTFNKATSSKYEGVFAGNNYPDMVEWMEKNGEDTTIIMKYINAALNDDWDAIRGSKQAYLEDLQETIVSE